MVWIGSVGYSPPRSQAKDFVRRLSALFCGLFCLVLCPPLRGQGTTAASQAPDSGTQIDIGHSISALYGPWKFTVGDSPQAVDGSGPVWAKPGFDDSKWETLDLTPKASSFDPVTGISKFVPGWTSRGHAGYWGYAWYRIRVRVATQPGQRLAVEGPTDVDDAYEVYANGRLLGSFGKFSRTATPEIYNTQPSMFELPDEGGDGTQVLAFRVWMEPSTMALQPDTGGFHTPPLLGELGAIEARYQLDWLQNVRAYVNAPVQAIFSLLLAIVALSLMAFDRSDRVYAWLAVTLLLRVVDAGNLAILAWTRWEGSNAGAFEIAVSLPLMLGAWLMVWWMWFRLREPVWIPKAIVGLTAAYVVSNALGEDLFIGSIPHGMSAEFHVASVVLRLVLLALLIFIVALGIRRQGREGWLALPAVLLMGAAQFQNELNVLHVRTVWFPFGVQLSLGTIAHLALVAVMFVLLLRRLTLSMRRQREMALDMKQAQEVQHVLLPEVVNVPGLRIESEYRPAREVGGDFFQIIPDAEDGSALIVVGDVAGKGLQAGMLVALLVGAMRSTLECTADPKALLEALNRRLLGRGDAHATCLALRIGRDGSVTLANAGHLPPYVNGVEVAMEGALPLGSMSGAEFSVTQFQLGVGDTLTLISDGIVEATDERGGLFGFERVTEILRTKVSAAALAAAAQRFGQVDDISVVSVTRVG